MAEVKIVKDFTQTKKRLLALKRMLPRFHNNLHHHPHRHQNIHHRHHDNHPRHHNDHHRHHNYHPGPTCLEGMSWPDDQAARTGLASPLLSAHRQVPGPPPFHSEVLKLLKPFREV